MYCYSQVGALTLQLLEELNKNRVKSVILTKGLLPSSLANAGRFGTENDYGITLVSLDDEFKKRFEPYAAPYLKRVSSLRFLHSKGLKTWISIEPYPTPNIIKQDLQRILDEVSFVDKIVFGKMNYSNYVTQFKERESFYEECAERVVEYCQESHIELHIKRGTSKVYDAKREILMKEKPVKGSNPVLEYGPSLFG
jgi:DNA repair photolyase